MELQEDFGGCERDKKTLQFIATEGRLDRL